MNVIAFLGGVEILTLFYEWVLRKSIARTQGRIGPSFTGPGGILQPVADFVKLLFKEDVSNKYVHPLFEWLPPITLGVTTLALLLIPVEEPSLDAPYSLLLLCTFIILESLLVFLMGYSSSNIFSLVGGMRHAAQSLISEIPLLLSILSVGVAHGSYSLVALDSQWNITRLPISFIVFIFAALVETNLLPFDAPEAESELSAGWLTEFSGRKLALLRLNADYKLALMSFIAASLFLGGGPLYILMLKAIVVTTFFGFVHATSGRLRIDQIAKLAWYVGIPLIIIQMVIL